MPVMGGDEMTAEEIYARLFGAGAQRRSEAFKRGCVAALSWCIAGQRDGMTCEYPEGSAECDAFWSGSGVGREIFRTAPCELPKSDQVRRSLTPKALPTSMQPYRAHELANGNSVGMDENVPPPWF